MEFYFFTFYIFLGGVFSILTLFIYALEFGGYDIGYFFYVYFY